MKTKFAIGCLTQWYEADIIEEYIDSLADAINEYDGEVLVDFVITKNHEQHEHFNGTPKDMEKCLDGIKNKTQD